MREGDTAARLGGDEFVVLVEGSTLDAGPELVAERLLEVLRQPYDMSGEIGRELSVTASIGIAFGLRESADELLRDADVALYEAKAAGQEPLRAVRVRACRPPSQRSPDARRWTSPTRSISDQLFLLYQPTFDLQSERVIGVEALIRWRHPTRGVLAPADFIPLAETTGLIVPIGRWVLERGLPPGRRLARSGAHRIGMSVNVSARQLDTDELIDDVRARARATAASTRRR